MSGRAGAYLRQNVLGLVAIFLALSAGAYAVQKAPKNSVVSKSIKDGQVRTDDLADAAVTAEKLGFDPFTQAELEAFAAGLAAGTVTSVGTGAGLSGGPITEAGTIALNACPTNQILKSTGGDYACANDVDTDTNSGGTVTSVGTGSGLTGGPITGTGSVALSACPTSQILKSTGSGNYSCQADLDTNTTYTAGAGLALSGGNAFSVQSCASGFVLRSTGAGWGCSNNYWGFSAIPGDGDTTPSVAGLELLELANLGATAITNLDNGLNGQRVTLIADGNTTISDSGAGVFRLSTHWAGLPGDTLTLIHNFGNWFEVARSDN